MKGLVYIAGPIDLTSNGHDSKEAAARMLNDRGLSVYTPWTAFRHVQGNGARIRKANLSVIKTCTAMLAIIDAKCYSHGTSIDIECALNNGIPVFMVVNDIRIPAYLEDVPCFVSVEDAIDAMDDMMSSVELISESIASMWDPALKRYGVKDGYVQSVEDEFAEDADLRAGTARPIDYPHSQDGPPVAQETYLLCSTTDEHPIPKKSYSGDAGFDLYVKGRHSVMAGRRADIDVGTRVAIPDGFWGLILGRSSTFYKLGLQVHPAVIDSGWRGELKVSVYNPGEHDITIEDKDRIAQLIPIPSPNMLSVYVDELPEGVRGEKGFGSSGR